MKLTVTTLVALALAGSALAAPNNATLTIQHQLKGCHSWSFDGTSWSPSQKLAIVRGGVLTVVDNDVMPHTLIQVSGPKAQIVGAAMRHIGAQAHVAFRVRGTYLFKTRAGEDYPSAKGVKTIGKDNVLELVVKVA